MATLLGESWRPASSAADCRSPTLSYAQVVVLKDDRIQKRKVREKRAEIVQPWECDIFAGDGEKVEGDQIGLVGKERYGVSRASGACGVMMAIYFCCCC